jgi:hypothetical protein
MVRALEASEVPLLPDNYKIDVTNRILDMCLSNNYGNLVGFDWYIDILMKLVWSTPIPYSSALLGGTQHGTKGLLERRCLGKDRGWAATCGSLEEILKVLEMADLRFKWQDLHTVKKSPFMVVEMIWSRDWII